MDEKELEQLQLQVDKLTNEYEKLNTLTDETYKNKILNWKVYIMMYKNKFKK